MSNFFLQSSIRDKYIPDVPGVCRVFLSAVIFSTNSQIDHSLVPKVNKQSTRENPLAKSQRHNSKIVRWRLTIVPRTIVNIQR